MFAYRTMFKPRGVHVFLRRLRTASVTGRSFALLVWLTCAAATFPSSTAAPEAHPLVVKPAHAHSDTPMPYEAHGRVQGLSHVLTPSHGDLATVSGCWGDKRIHVQEAWQLAGAPGAVLVAVLDTGIDADQAGLKGRVVDSLNLVTGSDSHDRYGHGTLVAATIAAIAPNCALLNIKVADDRGFCTSERVAHGIRMATQRGAAVINLSLEVEQSPELESATKAAWQRGVVLVAACGAPGDSPGQVVDGGDTAIRYPAGYPEVIAVAATNRNDGVLWPPNSQAAWIDVAAPGVRTSVVMSDGVENRLTGTSVAAAHVSGVAALLCGIAVDTNCSGVINDEVRHALECTAQPLGTDGAVSRIVDAQAAVAFLLS